MVLSTRVVSSRVGCRGSDDNGNDVAKDNFKPWPDMAHNYLTFVALRGTDAVQSNNLLT